MQRDYSAAVAALNTLQSNFATIEAVRKSGVALRNEAAIPEMREWCRKAGYEPSQLDAIKPIHIAGTKGKGSTSAFISSILAQYLPGQQQNSPALRKIGLYTSPHLRFVRERIRINGEPISEELFTKYFFEVWDRLEAAAAKEGNPPEAKPVYFRFLTLMAFHAYMQEGVDAAIIECGIGGEYDSTNILVHPSVTAVTSLGIDHTALLGKTIDQIAWQKAGIFKSGTVAFTAPQPEEALAMLRSRAEEKGVKLHVIPRHPELETTRLGLSADFQKTNASLAVAVAAAHLRSVGHSSIPDPTTGEPIALPEEFRRGLEKVSWPGRCDLRREGNIIWHLDGGHTMESIELSGKWFAEQLSAVSAKGPSQKRILIFNQQGAGRDPEGLAKRLNKTLQTALAESTPTSASFPPFTHAFFTTNVTFASGYKPDLISMNTDASEVDALGVQNALAKSWAESDPSTQVKVTKTIEEAIREVRAIAAHEQEDVLVLITGSLHLVGGALEVLEGPADL